MTKKDARQDLTTLLLMPSAKTIIANEPKKALEANFAEAKEGRIKGDDRRTFRLVDRCAPLHGTRLIREGADTKKPPFSNEGFSVVFSSVND